MSIFNYTDISTYLRQYISGLPRKGRGEGLRIAKHLRVSTTLISQVLSGRKSFTPEQARSLSGYLGLQDLEADYLIFLNHYDRSGSAELRAFWKVKLAELRERALKLSSRVKPKRILNDQERALFYSSPLYSAVRLFTSVGSKGKTLNEVCERFEIPRAKGSEILKFLVETGLCVAREDHFTLGAQSTHLEQGSPHLVRHHSNWRLRALQVSEALTAKELMYTAPVSLSHEDFDRLREDMADFVKKFLAKVHDSPAEEVACFNLDFFWVRK